ncbi:hypothetical protein [Paenarthrobacter ilicis]|uniref:Uncharacterized protein n=1 Tax=Paenarthrobacter ilicis TaxID=43665 RepID=A0ABX0TCT1_9MICC|nr:hypothetical protein [Paenarthrobacter ilicis]MBM7794150.1 hypothetical protein [Paenarthrobacter ilicis]NIJ00330.1 hypothetical protein [Paenarthrobacter ilicis]
MSFFEHLPEPPARTTPPQPIRPAWSGPPTDELPGTVDIGEFLHRGEHTVLAVKTLEVYSTGCLLTLVWSVRRGNESDGQWRELAEESFNRPLSGVGSGLELGVKLADDRRVAATFHDASAREDPAGPVLTVLGGGGSGSNDFHVQGSGRYWLWPLAAGGDILLVARWAGLGIDESTVVLPWEPIDQALGRVRNYFST